MEPVINKQEILSVWHAFSRETDIDGWRSIKIGDINTISIIAGCKFPEKEEYIAFGFNKYNFPISYSYPQCKGFYVLQNDNLFNGNNTSYLVLIKNRQAGIDLFVTMIEDLFSYLQRTHYSNEDFIFKGIISRIRLWQRFLSKTVVPVLSPEKEVGLLGELFFLNSLITNLDKDDILDSWRGPLDEPKDFLLGNGGVEVKSTTLLNQFRAKINSIEQLDTSSVSPLYLVGYRFELDNNGINLPSYIEKIREAFIEDDESLERFNSLLVSYGYIDIYASKYTNTYSLEERLIIKVCGDFPRITIENAMSGILEANYEIDISNLAREIMDDEQILRNLGVLL